MENPNSKSNRRDFLANSGKVFGGGALAFGLMGMSLDNVPEESNKTPVADLLKLSREQRRGLSPAAQKVSPADLKTIVDPYNPEKKLTGRLSPVVSQLTFSDLSALAGAVSQAAGGPGGPSGLKVDCSESICCCCCCCCC